MKGSIEASNLRQVRKTCGHCLNPLDFSREVERCIGSQLPQVLEELRIHLFGGDMVSPPVHDAMPYRLGRWELQLLQNIKGSLDCGLMVVEGTAFFPGKA